jgi:hypothetical protein
MMLRNNILDITQMHALSTSNLRHIHHIESTILDEYKDTNVLFFLDDCSSGFAAE